MRAIKWASLRLKDRGIVAYVTNGGWLDSNAFDGMRLSLTDEFSSIYVYNLRGNQRTAGEQSRKEGGKVFGGGSRATVAITLLVKDPDHVGESMIHYADIGDYLTRGEKLAKISETQRISGLDLVGISPDKEGGWLSQRRDDFRSFMEIKGPDGIFASGSLGISTNRDWWAIGSQREAVESQLKRLTKAFNDSMGQPADQLSPVDVSWSRSLRARFAAQRRLPVNDYDIRISTYRPFHRQWSLMSGPLVEAAGKTPKFFERDGQLAMAVLRPNDRTPFAVVMVDSPPNLGFFMDPPDVLPLYRKSEADSDSLLDLGPVVADQPDLNITDHALARIQAGDGTLTKEDVFFYVYGLLHSPDYRETYAADLKKSLPRIPLVADVAPFVEAGRKLSELHLSYETVEPYPLDGLDTEFGAADPYEHFRVEKMKFAKVRDPETKKLAADKSTIMYNGEITLSGIPETAYRYMLGSRSAIEWIIDRYQVKTDKPSGIVNDPNDWSREVEDPRYIIDLLARIITVSLETMQIVDNLPALDIREDQN